MTMLASPLLFMKRTVLIKFSLAIGTVLALGTGALQAGEISGKVILSGTPPAEQPLPMDATCGKLHPTTKPTTRHWVVGEGKGLGDVLVYVKTGAPKGGTAGPAPLLDQKDCMYEPYIWGVMVGQEFKVKNSDPFLHNVHATPKINKEFNLGQPLKDQVNTQIFAKPELMIRIKCDVHPWMFTYASALDHPYFAVTDKDGKFTIKNVPAGKYTVEVVHRKAGEKAQEVTVGDDKKPVEFTLTVPAAP
jgi:hypothetical protein